MTKVKFYAQPGGEILAYFPDEPYYSPETNNDHRTRTCYAHVGQHSACHPDYLKKCRLAAPEEFVDLLAELKGQGYDDLEVIDARKPLTKILSNVSSPRGAPMGRPNVGKPPTDQKIYDSHVPFEDGCYDTGGAYWGSPANLRVKYTKDLSYIEFYRK